MEKVHNSALTHKIAAFICGLCLLFILLTTSFQAVCFWIPNWWRNEYAKYNTPANVVTEDMLDYCIGRLDTLDNSMATIDGVKAPFFTDREKAHLADCRELFMAGLRGRVIAMLILVCLLIYIYIHNGKTGTLRLASRGYLESLGVVTVLGLIVTALAVIDFTFVFTKFHHIFFDNDLWILYPDQDNLINIMQEDVFSDAAAWIGSIFGISALLLAVIAIVILRRTSEKTA